MKNRSFLYLLIMIPVSTVMISCYGDGTGIERTCANTYGLDYDTDLILTTQKDVDNAISQTHILGNVYIGSCRDMESSEITNLRGLANLEKIDGRLVIFKTGIVTLEGLEKLQEIGGVFSISENPEIKEVGNLNKLVKLNSLSIFANPKLERISGFSQWKNCEGDLEINVNEELENIGGFDKLEYIGGTLSIQSHNSLIKVEGFEKLETISGELLIRSNTALTDLDAFNNLTQIDESLDLRYNWALKTLDNFQNLNSIGLILTIENHKELQSINGLDNLKRIGNSLYIADNSKLSDYCGLTTLIQTENGLQEGDSGDPFYIPYFQIKNNLFNPTRQELFDGNCAL